MGGVMRIRRIVRLGALAAAVAAALVTAASASAMDLKPHPRGDHPNGFCDSTDCTLREAVGVADSNIGPDRIILKGGKIYTLSVPSSGDENGDADGDLDVYDDLTIMSDSKTPAIINANQI